MKNYFGRLKFVKPTNMVPIKINNNIVIVIAVKTYINYVLYKRYGSQK